MLRGRAVPGAHGQPSPRRASPRCRRAIPRGRIRCCPSRGHPCARWSRRSRAQPHTPRAAPSWRHGGAPGAPRRWWRRCPRSSRSSRLPRSTPYAHPAAAAAACTSATVVPAPAESWPPSASTSLTPASRRRLSTISPFERDAPAHQARVASLGDEGDAGVSADLDHGRHLPAVAGPDHGRRCTDETPGPVDGVRRHHVRLDDQVPRSHDVAELLQHTRRHSSILARGAPAPSAHPLEEGARRVDEPGSAPGVTLDPTRVGDAQARVARMG